MSGTYKEELVTVSEVAKMANRSAVTVRRWIKEGLLIPAFHARGYNAPQYLDKREVELALPGILELMESRVGGRGKRKDTA